MGDFLILTFPQQAAVQLIESQQRFARAPAADIDGVAIDQRRGRVAPLFDRVGNLAVEFLHQVVLPEDLPIDSAETKKFEVRAQHINPLADDGGRGARAVAALVLEDGLVDLALPDFLAIVGVEADADFVSVALHHEIAALGDDGDRAKRLADGNLPDDFGPLGRPGLADAHLRRDPIMVRPAILRPISGDGE